MINFSITSSWEQGEYTNGSANEGPGDTSSDGPIDGTEDGAIVGGSVGISEGLIGGLLGTYFFRDKRTTAVDPPETKSIAQKMYPANKNVFLSISFSFSAALFLAIPCSGSSAEVAGSTSTFTCDMVKIECCGASTVYELL